LNRLLKQKGEWNHDISNHTCVNWNTGANNSYPDIELNLLPAFQTATGESILPYHLEQNGRNYPAIQMKMERLTFAPKASTPNKIEDIGIWKAGLGDKDLITFKNNAIKLKEHAALVVYRVVVVVVTEVSYVAAQFWIIEKYKNV